MSYALAAVGIIVLVILHELGHFTAAKAVGMRVEQFSLFFGPKIFKKRVGETEYAIGTLPLGGYVRITGMNPREDLPDEVRTRAYHAQPVWKRIVVILAGPAVNFVVAFILLVVFYWQVGAVNPNVPVVGPIAKGFPAAGVLQPGDKLLSVDGHTGTPETFSKLIQAHRCPLATPTAGCRASTPATIVVQRQDRRFTVRLAPVYDTSSHFTRIGFQYQGARQTVPFGSAVGDAGSKFGSVTGQTAALPARLFNAQQRKQLHGIIGSYKVTQLAISQVPGDAIGYLGLISLALAVVNLFPFLPLDGGHIFWAIVELIRRKPVPYSTMERSGLVGFALVLVLFAIGFSNDISTLSNGGFHVR